MAATEAIVEEGYIPICYIPEIPKLKYHQAPMHFMSEPGMTQVEYERKAWAGRLLPRDDDTITIKCPDRTDGAGRIFHFRRSVLKRAPLLAKFFKSEYYLHGCNMLLTCLLDPAVCIDITHKYLEQGPDIFLPAILRVSLTMRYKLVDRCIILIRLFGLAQRWSLPGLMEMASIVLMEADPQIGAEECITLSSLIFAKNAGFDKHLKDWCMDHISNHISELQEAVCWREVLWKTEVELPQRWARLLQVHDSKRNTLLNYQLQDNHDASSMTTSERTIKPLPAAPPKEAAVPPVRTSSLPCRTPKSKQKEFQAILDSVPQSSSETDEDEEWGETEAFLAETDARRGTSSKVVRLLGYPAISPMRVKKSQDSWPHVTPPVYGFDAPSPDRSLENQKMGEEGHQLFRRFSLPHHFRSSSGSYPSTFDPGTPTKSNSLKRSPYSKHSFFSSTPPARPVFSRSPLSKPSLAMPAVPKPGDLFCMSGGGGEAYEY